MKSNQILTQTNQRIKKVTVMQLKKPTNNSLVIISLVISLFFIFTQPTFALDYEQSNNFFRGTKIIVIGFAIFINLIFLITLIRAIFIRNRSKLTSIALLLVMWSFFNFVLFTMFNMFNGF